MSRSAGGGNSLDVEREDGRNDVKVIRHLQVRAFNYAPLAGEDLAVKHHRGHADLTLRLWTPKTAQRSRIVLVDLSEAVPLTPSSSRREIITSSSA